MTRFLIIFLAVLAASGCASYGGDIGRHTSRQELTAIDTAIQHAVPAPVTCATSKCDTAYDVDPSTGGLYQSMDGFLQEIERLPWENAQAPPQIAVFTLPWLGGTHATAVPIPDGFWPLQTTLVPSWSAGSGTPTFVRATTRTCVDFEGLVRTNLASEPCFSGARRVQNIAGTKSENATFTPAGTAAPTESKVIYGGKSNVSAIVFPTGAEKYADSRGTFAQSAVAVTSSAGVLRALVALSRPLVANEKLYLADDTNGWVALQLTASVQPSTTLTVMSGGGSASVSGAPRFTVGVGNSNFGAGADALTAPITVYITEMQWENVTGQANQNPSEYVSCGVLAAPWHGAGVDCVAYKMTLNGNTVP